jgi:hypothetical protein
MRRLGRVLQPGRHADPDLFVMLVAPAGAYLAMWIIVPNNQSAAA